MADWFTELANQALKLADEFTDSLVAQATEAQEQIQKEQEKLKEEVESRNQLFSSGIQLPWETEDESRQILSEALMDSVLKLSLNEKNFTVVPPNSAEVNFSFSDFVATAMRLLQLDANLAHVHAKVSPKMDEELFWRNYYCRVIYLRAVSGIDGPAAQEDARTKWGEGTSSGVIFDAVAPPKAQSPISRGTSGDQRAVGGSSQSSSRTSPKQPQQSQTRGEGNNSSSRSVADEDHELLVELGLDGDDGVEGDGAEGEEDEEELDLGDLDDLDDLDLLAELRSEEGGEGEEGLGSAAQKGDGAGCGKGRERETGELGSYEEVGKSDCNSSSNAELEAQIAAELANLSDDDS